MNESLAVASGERAVFVSYATADRKQALSVCKAIEARGAKCWISTRDVEPGENCQEAIVRSIRQAGAMVLVFSDAANNSDEIKKELSLASRFHVPVMALRIEDVEPSDAFAYELSTRQWIDAFEGWDQSIDTLVGKLEQLRPSEAGDLGATAERPRRPRPLKRHSRWRLAFAGLVVIAIIGIAAGLIWKPFGTRAPMTVQIAGFEALAGIPAETPRAFEQELRAAFGDDNAVAVKDRNATFKLGGSIRRVAGKMHYSVQMIDSRTGEMIWSGDRDTNPESGSLAPQQVAHMVVTVVRCGLADAMDHPGKLPRRTLSLYIQHCRIVNWGDSGGPERGMDVIKKVIQQAPNFSKAWSQLALDAALAVPHATPEKKPALVATGTDAVRRALKLDPQNGQAYMASAMLQPATAWRERERLHRKSVEVRESDCGCEHERFGSFLMTVGRPSEAVAEFGRAVDMQPNSLHAMMGLAVARWFKGDIAGGDRVVSTLAEFWKGSPVLEEVRLVQAIDTGRWEQAGGPAKAVFFEPSQAPLAEGFAAIASKNPRRIAAARTALTAMTDDHTADYRTVLLAQMGANKEAFIAARRRLAMNDIVLLLEPGLAPLRSDPEWAVVVKSTGLVDYWRKTKKPPEFCRAAGAPTLCRTL